MESPHRIGLIVPSSNTTMETEIPELFRRHGERSNSRFTFHSSRAVLHTVDPESLREMVGQVDRCASELADAQVDVVAYACLIAVMAEGPGAHAAHEARIAEAMRSRGVEAPVVSSAGALVRGIQALGLERVAVVAPYAPALTARVVEYLHHEGITTTASVSLEVTDNQEVGRLDPGQLAQVVSDLDVSGADGLVLSACVQMPSLPAIQEVEDAVGIPVLTAATATAWDVLRALDLDAQVPEAGALLDGVAVEAAR